MIFDLFLLEWWDFFVAHATILEVLWTGLGILGLIIVYKNLKHINEDLDALRTTGRNGITRSLALAHLRTEVFRGLFHSVTFIIGVAAMITAPVDPNQPISPLGVILTVGFFSFSMLTVAQSYLDSRLRAALDDDLDKIVSTAHAEGRQAEKSEHVDDISEAHAAGKAEERSKEAERVEGKREEKAEADARTSA